MQLAGSDEIDLGEVLVGVCDGARRLSDDKVTIVADIQPMPAPATLAHTLALATNELILNAIRHAFPAGRGGTVRVDARHADGELVVVVSDDGDGLPDGFAPGAGHGFGMQLVTRLMQQVGGTLSVKNGAGAQFTLTAPGG